MPHPGHFRVRPLVVCIISGVLSDVVCNMETPSYGTLHDFQARIERKTQQGLSVWFLLLQLLPLRPEVHVQLQLSPAGDFRIEPCLRLASFRRPHSSTVIPKADIRVRQTIICLRWFFKKERSFYCSADSPIAAVSEKQCNTEVSLVLMMSWDILFHLCKLLFHHF